jgi:hypothetical protein
VDERGKHLRKLKRRKRGSRRWSVLAGMLGGAAAILVPYAGIGLPDAFWAAGAGGSLVIAIWRWRDYRELAALPVPPPTDPAEAALALRRKVVSAVGSVPIGHTALVELRRQRSKFGYRGLRVAPLWQRLDRASQALTGIAGRLGGSLADGALLEAAGAEQTLRELVDRAAAIERALRVAPPESHPPLRVAHEELLGQLSDGIAAYERLVAAAAGYLAEDGRTGAKYLDPATTRLTEAADLLRGVAAGLAELRGT